MASSTKTSLSIICLLYALLLTGCTAIIPSISSGTGVSLLLSANDIPKRVSINSEGISQHDPVGTVLRSELPRLGFLIVESDPDAIFSAKVTSSDYSPVHLGILLSDSKDGRVLWSTQIVRKWDIYSSVVSASKSNAKKAMELIRKDLEEIRGQK